MSSTSKFKEGDRVIAIAPCDGESGFIGVTGVVKSVNWNTRLSVLVRFDKQVHTRMGPGYSWFSEANSLRLIPEYDQGEDDELYV